MKRLPPHAPYAEIIQAINDIMETLGCIPAEKIKCKENCRCSVCYNQIKESL